MRIHCEICGIRDGEKVRAGDHTALGVAKDIKLPLKGHMIGSPDEYRKIPPPFPTAGDWKEMRCRRCGRVPFQFMPDDLDRYNDQGGPDRIYTDDGWYWLGDGSDPEMRLDEDHVEIVYTGEIDMSKRRAHGAMPEDVDTCPACGKPEAKFKNKSGFKNHVRFCERKHGRKADN